MNPWKRVLARWRTLKSDFQQAALARDEENHAHNAKVSTRQVRKRLDFQKSMQFINKHYGGEPRANRRRMARSRAWRLRMEAK